MFRVSDCTRRVEGERRITSSLWLGPPGVIKCAAKLKAAFLAPIMVTSNQCFHDGFVQEPEVALNFN